MTNLVQDLIAGQSRRHPRAAAVVSGRDALTYGDIEIRSNQLARVLRGRGCRRGDRVCVWTGESTETAVVAMVAAFKADAIFVPLPIGAAPARLAEIVRTSEPACILTSLASSEPIERVLMTERLGVTVIGHLHTRTCAVPGSGKNFGPAEVSKAPGGSVPSRSRAGDPACLVFSAAPGAPGVVWTHAGISRLVTWARELFDIQPEDRHPLLMPAFSDRMVCQALVALAGGARLVEPTRASVASARSVSNFLRRSQSTHWWASAEMLKSLASADLVAPGDFPSLRHVVCWSADVGARELRYWRTRLGHATFTVLVGAAETMMASAYYTVRDELTSAEDRVPLGAACPGQEVLVLDDDHRPVEAGQVGAIHVRGVGLSPGYWRDPEATGRAFGNPMHGPDRTFQLGLIGRRETDGHIYSMRPTGQAS